MRRLSALLLFPLLAFSQEKVSQMPAANLPLSTNEFATLVQSGWNITNCPNVGTTGLCNVQTTVADILNSFNPQTPAEAAASITPANYFVAPCNINRYGINTTPGTTLMSTALSNALSVCSTVYIPGGKYLASAQVPNTTQLVIRGDGASSILVQPATGSVFSWAHSGAPNYAEQTITDLAFIGTNGAANTINTAGTGGVTLKNLYFTDTPVGFDSIFANGSGGTYVHDQRFRNIQIYSNTAGNAGMEFGALSSDANITGLIMNGNFDVSYCLEFDSGAQTTTLADSHPYNCATHIVYAVGNNSGLLFTGNTLDNSNGDLVLLVGTTQALFTGDFFEAASAGHNAVTLTNTFVVNFSNDMFTAVSGAGFAINETGTSDYTYVTNGNVSSTDTNWTSGINNIIGPHSQVCMFAGALNVNCGSLGTFTVSGLPGCNASSKYLTAIVTDASSPTYNGTLTGSSTTTVPVFCNGTAWTAH